MEASKMGNQTATPPTLIHLNLSDTNVVTQEEEITLADGNTAKVIWKDVLVEGTYPMSPGPGGATSDPMTVVADGKSDEKTKTMSFADIEAAHEDGAFKYVTIPKTHRDGLEDNTGYIPDGPSGLRRRTREDGKQVLQVALGFTEPDIKGKVMRGTIPDISGGFFFNWVNKAKKKLYPLAMKHAALTGTPFMGNLDRFPAAFCSDEQLSAGEEIPEGTKVEFYAFADEDSTSTTDTDNKVDVVWNEEDTYQFRRRGLEEALNPQRSDDSVPYDSVPHYYVEDLSTTDTALVEEFFKGKRTRWVIPFEAKSSGVSPSPATRWVEVKEAMIAASDSDFDEQSYGSLKEKVSVALADSLGKTDTVYRVDEVSRDNRARIVNKAKGRTWLAEFSVLDNGLAWIAPADQWKVIDQTTKNDVQSTPAAAVAFSDTPTPSTPRARLEAARAARKNRTTAPLSATNSTKGV
jgi:hypothetical protein